MATPDGENHNVRECSTAVFDSNGATSVNPSSSTAMDVYYFSVFQSHYSLVFDMLIVESRSCTYTTLRSSFRATLPFTMSADRAGVKNCVYSMLEYL